MATKKVADSDLIHSNCRTRRGLSLIADQWTLLVIVALREEKKRFTEIHAQVDGISKKMLTQTLRGLERNGLVKRVVYPMVPPMVEYSLTPLGKTLIKPIWALRDWSEEYIEVVEQERIAYDRQEHTSLQDDIMHLVEQRGNDA